jgi:hypothetical protein
MDKGASKAIYNNIGQYKAKNANHELILRKALEECEANEKKKIQNILYLEEFLVPIQNLFDAILNTNEKNIKAYSVLANELHEPDADFDFEVLPDKGTALARYKNLIDAVRDTDKIGKLLKYHEDVQNERGTPAWLTTVKGEIKRAEWKEEKTIDQWIRDNKDTMFWRNDYYLSSIKILSESIEGKNETSR